MAEVRVTAIEPQANLEVDPKVRLGSAHSFVQPLGGKLYFISSTFFPHRMLRRIWLGHANRLSPSVL
jgi:hypothetical protein